MVKRQDHLTDGFSNESVHVVVLRERWFPRPNEQCNRKKVAPQENAGQ